MSESKTLAKFGKKNAGGGKMPSKKALAAAIKGKYAWIPYSSEDFNRDKRREIALEGDDKNGFHPVKSAHATKSVSKNAPAQNVNPRCT